MRRLTILLTLWMLVFSLRVFACAEETSTLVTLEVNSLTVVCGDEAAYHINGGPLYTGTKIYRDLTGTRIEVEILPEEGYAVENLVLTGTDLIWLDENTVTIATMDRDAMLEIRLERLSPEVHMMPLITLTGQPEAVNNAPVVEMKDGTEYLLYNSAYEPVSFSLTEYFHSESDLTRGMFETEEAYQQRVDEYLKENPNIVYIQNVDTNTEQRSILLAGDTVHTLEEKGAEELCFANEQTAVMFSLNDLRSENMRDAYALLWALETNDAMQAVQAESVKVKKNSGAEMSELLQKNEISSEENAIIMEEIYAVMKDDPNAEAKLGQIYGRTMFEITVEPLDLSEEYIQNNFSEEEKTILRNALAAKQLCSIRCLMTYGDYQIDVTELIPEMKIFWLAEDLYNSAFAAITQSTANYSDTADLTKQVLEAKHTAFRVELKDDKKIVYAPIAVDRVIPVSEAEYYQEHRYPQTTVIYTGRDAEGNNESYMTQAMIRLREIWALKYNSPAESRIVGVQEVPG